MNSKFVEVKEGALREKERARMISIENPRYRERGGIVDAKRERVRRNKVSEK